jgi:hypothetical protein
MIACHLDANAYEKGVKVSDKKYGCPQHPTRRFSWGLELELRSKTTARLKLLFGLRPCVCVGARTGIMWHGHHDKRYLASGRL